MITFPRLIALFDFLSQRSRPRAVAWAVTFLLASSTITGRGAEVGPTVQLGLGRKTAVENPLTNFMYFVPLISPERVSTVVSPGSTQATRLLSATRKFDGNSFLVTCEFEFVGQGRQESVVDMERKVRQNRERLKAGVKFQHQLKSINVEGPGSITMETAGVMENGICSVTEVRLKFNANGRQSPVTIELCDIKEIDGDFRPANEVVARVNGLTFRRKPGVPKMEVTVASVKAKDAGDGLWQNFKGRLTGAAVNFFIPPLVIQSVGNKAMLDFGLALVNGLPAFTFPRATNMN